MAKRRGSGEGSIFQIGNRWVASITLDSTGGHQIRRKRSARTQAEARDLLRQMQKEKDAGVLGAKGASVGTYLDDWIDNVLPSRDLAPNTVANYTTILRSHVMPAIGTIKLDQLRAEHVDEMLRAMAKRDLAKSTIKRARSLLDMALTHAERRDLVMRNAAKLAIVPTAPTRESRSLTLDEAHKFLDAAKKDRLRTAYAVMLHLGLRTGEVLGLTWSDVDLKARHLAVTQALRQEPGRLVIVDPKTRKSRRTLDLPDVTVEALKAHRSRQAIERLAAGPFWEDHDLVFPTARGTLLDPHNFRRSFNKVATDAGLDDLHPHLLRHTAVSLLSDSGVPLEVVADVVGHSTTVMTEGVYRHPVAASVDAHVKHVDRMFGAKSG